MVGAGKLQAAKEKAPAPAAAPACGSSDTAKQKGGKPINIPLKNVSPELKAILVKEMIRGGGL